MTLKKDKILESALRLFAQNGFKGTSTNQVAKAAGVSEGLIFRHFGNKQKLVEAILDLGQERANFLYGAILMETNPKAVIRKTIELPFKIDESPEEKEFWRLQFKLKWELDYYNEEKLLPLKQALIRAFKVLKHPLPELEAESLLLLLEGVGGALTKNSVKDKKGLERFLKQKYEV